MTQEQLISLGWQLAGWVLTLALPAATMFGIRWLKANADNTKTFHGLSLLQSSAAIAVRASEQAIKDNPDKKRAALQFVQDYLDARGVHLPVIVIEGAVEAAVFSEIDHGTPPANTPPADTAPKA